MTIELGHLLLDRQVVTRHTWNILDGRYQQTRAHHDQQVRNWGIFGYLRVKALRYGFVKEGYVWLNGMSTSISRAIDAKKNTYLVNAGRL